MVEGQKGRRSEGQGGGVRGREEGEGRRSEGQGGGVTVGSGKFNFFICPHCLQDPDAGLDLCPEAWKRWVSKVSIPIHKAGSNLLVTDDL